MDRNSAIGLTIIAVLLLVYFNYFSPAPIPPKENPPSETGLAEPAEDPAVLPQQQMQAIDSAARKQYGSLYTLASGEEKETTIENSHLRVTFTNRGGVPSEILLKQFKTYYQQPLYLATRERNSFSLLGRYEGREIDLYQLFYHVETRKTGDSTLVLFTANLGDNAYLRHRYTIPASGYTMRYRMESSGLTGLSGDLLTFRWNNLIPPQEKDLTDSRNKTTITYFSQDGHFDDLSETSASPEAETFISPVKWVAFKQKFFISAIIAEKAFQGGEIKTEVPADTNTVKTAQMSLFIPTASVADGTASFTYFFGPNKYSLLQNVTEGFSKNLNIGWPPILWVNKFLIIPIFKFLELYIGNYGVIIMILVLIVKLILSPLSYKSYLGMAKMKLLKPELDLLKEKFGDDMTKIQQEQLKLYQQAGVNPFSGCIPLLLQMPILFAMFYFFPVSIELRQAGFLWADDLSTYDSIVNLPFTIPFYGSHVSLFVLLMTASTLVYTWQNNQISSVTGPMKSMSYLMPVIFMFVLNSFSAGLSFYYFVSNLVTFGQQALIKRFVDEDKIKAVMEEHKKKILAGDGKKSKFMTKLQEAMKASEEARKKGKR